MEERVAQPLTDRTTWTRLLFLILFAAVGSILVSILCLVALVQLVSKLFRGRVFEDLTTFGEQLAGYTREVVAFMTFAQDELPWPFEGALERQEEVPAGLFQRWRERHASKGAGA